VRGIDTGCAALGAAIDTRHHVPVLAPCSKTFEIPEPARWRGIRLTLCWIIAMSGVPAFAASAVAEDTISVVSLNLWHDKADWLKRQALIVRTRKAGLSIVSACWRGCGLLVIGSSSHLVFR